MKKKIQYLQKEPDGWWLELMPGWAVHPDDQDGTHVGMYDTKKEALAEARNASPCNCERRCKGESNDES